MITHKIISGVFCYVFLRSACHLSPYTSENLQPPAAKKKGALNCIGISKRISRKIIQKKHNTSVENKSGKSWLDTIVRGLRNCRKTIICHIKWAVMYQVCVLGVLMLPLFLQCLDWVLELFRQCSIFFISFILWQEQWSRSNVMSHDAYTCKLAKTGACDLQIIMYII